MLFEINLDWSYDLNTFFFQCTINIEQNTFRFKNKSKFKERILIKWNSSGGAHRIKNICGLDFNGLINHQKINYEGK